MASSRWTPDQSTILSLLLDDVVGTKEMVEVRKDFCQILEYCVTMQKQFRHHFTGSKAEGLDLPDSDQDYMRDINDVCRIKVIQSLDERPGMSSYSILLMCTENVRPCFAILQHVTPINPFHDLYFESQNMNGLQYLSSNLMVERHLYNKNLLSRHFPITVRRQGPSVEMWDDLNAHCNSGMDDVISIHCPFWPNVAKEWVRRPRHFGWPSSHNIASIIDFGFHLVPIGHPHSETKLMEWRISFSLAERTLVWSFNHVQIQCYALLKIIQKQLIKVRCSPQNQVLCSYFIKTFLFWKYETTESNFWRVDNFRECIMYLLTEFSKCIHEGEISHYFIPTFNLLSVKLTRPAQIELTHLFDDIIQSDIRILKDCRILHDIWSKFLKFGEKMNDAMWHIKRRNILRNDENMMEYILMINGVIAGRLPEIPIHKVIDTIELISCKTDLKDVFIKRILFKIKLESQTQQCEGNRVVYQLHRTVHNHSFSFDISSCKLWCAMLLFMRQDYASTLKIVNQVLSSIPPFALYQSFGIQASNQAKQLYVDMFLDSDIPLTQRGRQAWLFDLMFGKDMADMVPLAIKIELYFCSVLGNTVLSPFICSYYLQFLCFHEMHQYDNRDHALRQLVHAANDKERLGGDLSQHTSFNIAGHCLLVVGDLVQARDTFSKSHLLTLMCPPEDKYNSASWYLQNFL